MKALPEISLSDASENRLQRWKQLQAMMQHYWSSWQKEYLSELQTRVKWRQNFEDFIKVGTIALVKEDKVYNL
ncbi:hypothetical protein NQ314_003680 [Rhamnusium bicolor]|uniref:DUF5641 domain-containing protein n=1 Tax=Rhamnusium bicolor TaxID=1586634 RepID=A0AAV8ZLE3_9CUCU|nr:hypothetical protein NQ314_003680 [Rhamnusium bicolor]